ncbi:alpha/beta-hydrolase [Auriscalpium vulgare]|uniref:Alpha/beta-hydrolase n=1 Tax=Auriscalpium vulgare TaxID=40419 RepID=A0ACB8S563_9AGAM|nr:alpha/beta-hydrolase [Auriscalpium vulgare]
MVHEFRSQPVKTIYLLYEAIAMILFRFPYWILSNVPKSLRPRDTWTFQKAVGIKVVAHFNVITGRTDKLVDAGDHLNVVTGLDIKHVWVKPVPEVLNEEILEFAKASHVEPVSIPGYWLDRKDTDIPIGAPPQPDEKIVYSMHGGAYIRLSASPNDVVANIPKGLLEHCRPVRRVFAIEYRLSKAAPDPEENAFPAALFDALAGYVYLTQQVGFKPENIVVEGDSAGGNLALTLTRYLVENQGLIPGLPPPPGALLLLSPWTDMSFSDEYPGSSWDTNLEIDYLGGPYGPVSLYARMAFLGPLNPYDSPAALHRLISPASTHPNMPPVSFKGFPRTMIVAGEMETLLTQIRALHQKMEPDMGNGDGPGQVHYYESPDSVHDFVVFTFHEPERTQTLRAIAKWLGD